MVTNLHYYYNKKYFSGATLENASNGEVKGQIPAIRNRNSTLTEYSLPTEVVDKFYDGLPCTHILEYKIGYPGLVTGIGLGHEINAQGEYKLGMHFDYTYGIPLIYGSSVKGVLHSNFHHFTDRIRLENGKLKLYAATLPKNEQKGVRLADDEELAKMIERSIFGSTLEADDDESEHLPVGDRDIFFDGIPFCPQSDTPVLSADYLCPHGDNPFKNPVPISFLRISPDVMVRLAFRLVDTIISYNGSDIPIEANLKYVLYRDILAEVGLGAKTNVGYGVLSKTAVKRIDSSGKVIVTAYGAAGAKEQKYENANLADYISLIV